MLIAGNHDHPRKLARAGGSCSKGCASHVRADVRPPDQGGVVRCRAATAREEARVAVLPFVPERKVVDACQLMGPEHEWYEDYSRRHRADAGLPDRAASRRRTVNLVVGHLLISRRARGHRRAARCTSGQVYGVNAQQLPANAQYIAPRATCTGRRR